MNMSLLQPQPTVKQEGTDGIEDLPLVKKYICSLCGFEFSTETFLTNCFNCFKNIENPDDILNIDPTTVKKEEIDSTKLVEEQVTSELTLDIKDEEVVFTDTSVTVYTQFIDAAKAEKPEIVLPCGKYGNAAAQSTHTGQKPFRCTLCDYSDAYSCSLQWDMRHHTGERPFQCTLWNSTSTQSKHLIKHERTGEKKFKCSICDYATAWCSTLVRHMRIHTGEKPFKCTLCDYATTQSSTLIQHKITHTGKKPFKCTVCDYASARRRTLVRHMRKHSGQKLFKCDLCDYSCRQNTSLKHHKKKHTGET